MYVKNPIDVLVDCLNAIIATCKEDGLVIRDKDNIEIAIKKITYNEEYDSLVAEFEDIGYPEDYE